MVKLGPDTSGPYGTVGFLHYSGYWAGDDKIRGFSHLHLHGAGATDFGVLSMMPTLAFDPSKWSVVDYETMFDKADEHAAAGTYKVTLANGIAVELAATQRAAIHRYTLPAAGTLLVDLMRQLADDGTITAPQIALDSGELVGSFHAKGGMTGGYGGYTLYFAIAGSMPLDAQHVTIAPGTSAAAIALPAGASTLAVGLSFVSIAGARANREAELAARLVRRGRRTRPRPRGAPSSASRRSRRPHATRASSTRRSITLFLMPSVIDDADGTYQLVTMASPATATGYHQVSDQSLWDTYRTVIPLYSWLAPDSARDAARSLVGFADGLGAYPRWPIAIGESGTMLGASAEIAIADTIARGVPNGVDAATAWPLLKGEALDVTAPPTGRGERDAVDDYIAHGYVTSDAPRSLPRRRPPSTRRRRLLARHRDRRYAAGDAPPRTTRSSRAVTAGSRSTIPPPASFARAPRRARSRPARSIRSCRSATTPRRTRGSRCGWSASTIPTGSRPCSAASRRRSRS